LVRVRTGSLALWAELYAVEQGVVLSQGDFFVVVSGAGNR